MDTWKPAGAFTAANGMEMSQEVSGQDRLVSWQAHCMHFPKGNKIYL